MRKHLLAILSALCLAGIVATPTIARQLREIKFGVSPDYPPFESLSPAGQLQGFDIDLGRAICVDLKVKCAFVNQSFDGIIPALEARKFDAILSSMTVTPERAKAVDFSSEMYRTPSALVDAVQAEYGFLKTPKGKDFASGGDVTYDPKGVLGSYSAIGVRKNEQELLKKIDSAIAELHKSGDYNKIEARYFNFDVYGSPSKQASTQ